MQSPLASLRPEHTGPHERASCLVRFDKSGAPDLSNLEYRLFGIYGPLLFLQAKNDDD